MTLWIILVLTAIVCAAVFISIVIVGLKAGRDVDDRMDDLINKTNKLNRHAQDH